MSRSSWRRHEREGDRFGFALPASNIMEVDNPHPFTKFLYKRSIVTMVFVWTIVYVGERVIC